MLYFQLKALHNATLVRLIMIQFSPSLSVLEKYLDLSVVYTSWEAFNYYIFLLLFINSWKSHCIRSTTKDFTVLCVFFWSLERIMLWLIVCKPLGVPRILLSSVFRDLSSFICFVSFFLSFYFVRVIALDGRDSDTVKSFIWKWLAAPYRK